MAFNNGYKVFISPVPVGAADLTLQNFQAIDDWVEVINCGTLPDRGPSEGELSFATLANGMVKGKGTKDFGGGDIDVLKRGTNLGRDAMAAAANTQLNHAMRLVAPDSTGASAGQMTATTEYLRALVTGPRTPGGGGDETDIARFSVMINQYLIVPSAVIPE